MDKRRITHIKESKPVTFVSANHQDVIVLVVDFDNKTVGIRDSEEKDAKILGSLPFTAIERFDYEKEVDGIVTLLVGLKTGEKEIEGIKGFRKCSETDRTELVVGVYYGEGTIQRLVKEINRKGGFFSYDYPNPAMFGGDDRAFRRAYGVFLGGPR